MTTDTETVDPSVPDANVPEETKAEAESSPAVVADEKPEPKGVGKRIDELTRNWRETERDRDHWRDVALRNQTQKADPPVDSRPKTLADFEYDESKYQNHLFEQAEKRAEAAAERKFKEQTEKETATRRKVEIVTRERDFAKTAEDYFDVTRSPSLTITQDMADVMSDSEEGPAIAYYLGKNPEIADRIAGLPALAAAREIGRLEARLINEREKVKEAKAVVSKAPPPTPKLDGADPAIKISSTDPDSYKLSDDEWVRAENKRLARKANRQ